MGTSRIAQTNLQLFAQMAAEGYGAPDIARLRAAYGLAQTLFANAYRGSGKPFVCHLVGTASVTAMVTRDLDLILTGLLHAAYTLGRWPRALGGRSAGERDRTIAAVAGEPVALLLKDYTAFSWSSSSIERYASEPVEEPRRPMILLRLANEVDDCLDDAAFAADGKSKATDPERQRHILEIARRYDHPALEGLLADVFEPSARPEILSAIATGQKNTLRIDERLGDAWRRIIRERRKRRRKARASA